MGRELPSSDARVVEVEQHDSENCDKGEGVAAKELSGHDVPPEVDFCRESSGQSLP